MKTQNKMLKKNNFQKDYQMSIFLVLLNKENIMTSNSKRSGPYVGQIASGKQDGAQNRPCSNRQLFSKIN